MGDVEIWIWNQSEDLIQTSPGYRNLPGIFKVNFHFIRLQKMHTKNVQKTS